VKAWVSILNCIGASDHVLKIVRVLLLIFYLSMLGMVYMTRG